MFPHVSSYRQSTAKPCVTLSVLRSDLQQLVVQLGQLLLVQHRPLGVLHHLLGVLHCLLLLEQGLLRLEQGLLLLERLVAMGVVVVLVESCYWQW
jgi:hypothetical protein